MQRVTRSTAVAVAPAPPASPGPPGFFTPGNPGGGIPATIPGYEWFNAVQEELVAPILRAGLTPSATDLTQLRQAMDRLYGGGLRTVTANTTLTADDAGLVIVDASGGSRTITLPAANAAGGRPIRIDLVRADASANAVTIQRAGSDTIEGLTTITLAANERLQLVGDGSGAWRFAAGRHTQSIASPGWQRLPSGLIIQWGDVTAPTGVMTTVSYPLAFPTGALVGTACCGSVSPSNFAVVLNIRGPGSNAAQFQIGNNSGTTLGVDYIVIGR
jgi:hypothetical protein